MYLPLSQKRGTLLQITHEETLFDRGQVELNPEFQKLYQQVLEAIRVTDWPDGSGKFSIYPERHGNGVKPIKIPFLRYLKNAGWNLETKIDYGITKTKPGPIDATHPMNGKIFAVEWETGNISSSHRSLGKMAIGLAQNILVAGILVLPSQKLYYYLTDRIGSYSELEPYFGIFRGVQCDYCTFKIIEVEHDELSSSVPKIPKGSDGNALYRQRLAEIRKSSIL
ncbi:MAG: restriction endonuclease [Chloroflexi bacterium]|nr:restriction endonuclease [Chloroflexota bacterium]